VPAAATTRAPQRLLNCIAQNGLTTRQIEKQQLAAITGGHRKENSWRRQQLAEINVREPTQPLTLRGRRAAARRERSSCWQ
jgi:hypothetical protein